MSDLATQADALHDRYRKGFAGRSRVTRDLAALDTLIAETEAFLGGLGSSATLRAQVEERLGTYRSERQNIAKVQAGGQDAVDAWRLADWSEITYFRYGREYGGRARPPRDLALLAEMAADQKAWLATAKPLAQKLGDEKLDAQVKQMETNASLYSNEHGEIARARQGQAPIDRVSTLANAANRQFGLYRLHFEKKDRRSRRPGLLRRMISELETLHKDMEATQRSGISSQANADNIGKVSDRIRHHREELAKIEDARKNTPTSQIAALLGDDANAWLARYRAEFAGKSRDSRELAPLADICEGLHEVARAMAELERERGGFASNAKNLTVVLEQLKMMEREFVRIRDAKRGAAKK